MGFRVVPGVPLGAWNPVPELIEDVRDLFIMDSSISEVIPLFRLPGLEQVWKIFHVETQHIDVRVCSCLNDKLTWEPVVMVFHWAKVVQKQSVHSHHCHSALENTQQMETNGKTHMR